MKNQSESTPKEFIGQDRLALGALLLGLFLFCPVTGLLLLYWYYLGARWDGVPQRAITMLVICLFEAMLISFAAFRIARSDPGTKQSARGVMKNFFMGAILASLAGLIMLFIARPASLGVSWGLDLVLVGILPRVLITGVPAGGLGAVILGTYWKHKGAAVIGALAAELFVSPILLSLFSCKFIGGC